MGGQSTPPMLAYQKMGTLPTWTCAPYQTEHAPKFGQQIAWGESNAIVFANSVLGARTERYPDLLDICAALTGRVPAVGLHLDENRGGQLVFDLASVPDSLAERDDFYPVLGHLVGQVASDKVPVIVGLAASPNENQLKALGAAAASSGSVGLFHIVGVTPEAPTLKDALRGKASEEHLDISVESLRRARKELTTATGETLELVVLGSPHFSLDEFRQLAPLLEDKKRHPDVSFLVTTSRIMRQLADGRQPHRAAHAFRGTSDRGHLHPGNADAVEERSHADDQLRQVRLVFPRATRRARGIRKPRGLHRVRGSGKSRPQPVPLGRLKRRKKRKGARTQRTDISSLRALAPWR